jgi:hypothetical protein
MLILFMNYSLYLNFHRFESLHFAREGLSHAFCCMTCRITMAELQEFNFPFLNEYDNTVELQKLVTVMRLLSMSLFPDPS